jgi:hypothetical protein
VTPHRLAQEDLCESKIHPRTRCLPQSSDRECVPCRPSVLERWPGHARLACAMVMILAQSSSRKAKPSFASFTEAYSFRLPPRVWKSITKFLALAATLRKDRFQSASIRLLQDGDTAPSRGEDSLRTHISSRAIPPWQKLLLRRTVIGVLNELAEEGEVRGVARQDPGRQGGSARFLLSLTRQAVELTHFSISARMSTWTARLRCTALGAVPEPPIVCRANDHGAQ